MWDKRKIADVCEIGDGNHSSNYPKSSEMISSGVPFLRAGNIKNGMVTDDDLKFISFEKHQSLKKGHLKKNDILITNRGEIGKTAIVPARFDGANLNSQIAWLRPNQTLLPKFLYYLLNNPSIKLNFSAKQTGTALQQLPIKQIKEIELLIPPLAEQQSIVAKLDAAFAEIDRIIHATKIKIQNYFKLEETNKSSFFSNLSSSLIELEKTSEIINGYAFKSGDFQHSNGVPVIKITNVGIRDFVETNDVNLPKDFLAKHKQFAVKQGDIVFALTRTVINGGLKVAVVPKNYEGALLNQRVAGVSANPKMMNSEFLYSYLSSSMVLDYVLSNVNTLMQPNLSITDLKKLPVPNIRVDKQVAYSQTLKETEIQFQNIRTIETKKLSELEKLKSAILAQELQSEAA